MKNIKVISLIVFSLFFLTGCGPKKEAPQTNSGNSPAGGSGIIVPENLEACPERFMEKKANGFEYMVNCTDEPKGEFCSYYTVTKEGVTKPHNLQFNTECIMCRTHKQKGEVFGDDTAGKYIHLGYEKKACTQGMYKKTGN